MASTSKDPREQALRERFGIEAFRPWQREAIDELLDGKRRVLAIAPTGGGKSLCYQFPATELQGVSIVISPLIALMEDQVRALEQRGIAATYLASNLDADERRKRERGLRDGKYKIIYVAPERLATGNFLNELVALKPELVAIDEAHCISQWGHDFRPDYLKLGQALKDFAPKHVIACTATATPLVREEILERLGLDAEKTHVVLRGFARPNLHLAAEQVDGAKERRKRIEEVIKRALGAPTKPQGSAIVYAGTRKATEEYASTLGALGYRTAAYHAGLDPETRAKVSHRFAGRDLDLVVATNAFGMGIDRADVRVVIHANPPGSIEAYYQEVGRAGRDDKPAFGLLLTSFSDFGFRKRLIESPRDSEYASDRAHIERQWKMFLDLMRYVDAGSCRHDFVLRYFGDEQELLGGCGHCDVCEALDEGGDNALSEEESQLIIRKALSGIARNKGRAGLHAVADMLAGTDSARIRELGLDTLSTYGLLKEFKKPWLLSLLRRLVTANLVELSSGEFPVPLMSKAGHEVMTGAKPARILLPREDLRPRSKGERKEKSARASKAPPEGIDVVLYDKLRETRMALAKAKDVPAYVVAHDRTLQEIALLRPKTTSELGMVHGMGPARIESYGEAFVSVVRQAG